jgi:twinkle protein
VAALEREGRAQGMWFYNHFGSLESDEPHHQDALHAHGMEVDFIVLDHISIVTSGVESSARASARTSTSS